MAGSLKGHLSEGACCAHHARWRNSLASAARKPYPLSGQTKHYAPDMPFQVKHLKLVVDVDPAGKTLKGVCHSWIEPVGKPLTEVFFEAEDLVVTRASIAGAAESLAFEHVEKGFKVQLAKPANPGETVEIALDYQVTDPKGGIYFTGPEKGFREPYQVWTQGQDEDAHFWFPVAGADFPNHKMTTEIVATVAKRYTALSNGKLVSETTDEEKGTRTFHWLLDKPHVSYLVALVVGVFEKLETSYKGIPVECYCDPELLPHAKKYFEDTDKLVALYSRLYGVEYPWPNYKQVLVRFFIFGGMENTTLTVITDRVVADESVREEMRMGEIRLNAHELNHHWHGDFVTCRDWSHGYLNEGGATYAEVEAMEHFYGIKERDYYIKGLADTYFAEDRGRYRRPIVSQYYGEPIDLFDRHLYQKAGLVRHMLRYLLGDEGYYKSVKTYLMDNAYGSVETLDLIKAIEKATGRNMRRFFDEWIFGAGYPEYGVTFKWDAANKVATVKVTQDQELANQTGLFNLPIVMSFGFADGSSKDFTVNVGEKSNSFHFALDQKPAMFRFDPENWILKTAKLNVPKSMLLFQAENDPCVMGRVYAMQALAKVGGDDVVVALEKAANADFHWGVSVEAAKCLGTVGGAKARDAMLRLATHAHPKVRTHIVNQLGSFKDEPVVDLFVNILSSEEKSVFVKAAAAYGLGKSKSPKAFEALKSALDTGSWNETIRVGVINGLAELGDEASLALISDFAGSDKPFQARPAAMQALGRLGKKMPKAVEHLHKLAEQDDVQQFTLFMALVGAMGESKSAESVEVLHKLKAVARDGRVKRVIGETIDGVLTAKSDPSKDAEKLKTQVEELTAKLRELTDKVDAAALGAHTHKPVKRKSRAKKTS